MNCCGLIMGIDGDAGQPIGVGGMKFIIGLAALTRDPIALRGISSSSSSSTFPLTILPSCQSILVYYVDFPSCAHLNSSFSLTASSFSPALFHRIVRFRTATWDSILLILK